MNKIYPELNLRIQEMADGDSEFQSELTEAIYQGLLELQEKYTQGVMEEDEWIIQQIRHKVKPTLTMFGFGDILEDLQEGKDILETVGFGDAFLSHAGKFMVKLEIAIDRVYQLTQ